MTDKPTATSEIFCPHCKKANTWRVDNQYRPFCSDRCKLIDLGDWATETHRVPGEPVEQNPEEDGHDEHR